MIVTKRFRKQYGNKYICSCPFEECEESIVVVVIDSIDITFRKNCRHVSNIRILPGGNLEGHFSRMGVYDINLLLKNQGVEHVALLSGDSFSSS